MPWPLLPTTVVGSYPQPEWLIDRSRLGTRLPPRIRARDLWRVPPQLLEQAQDDATVVAISDMERAGIDIVTDGEMRRESYSNRFATALDGVDVDHPAEGLGRSGRPDLLPRIVGPIRRREPVEVRDVQFLRSHTRRTIKITVPGPFTMTQQAVDQYYGDEAAAAFDYAIALNAEIHDLVSAGADIIQIDEPYLQARVEKARRFAIDAINRALHGVQVPTVLHTCFGYGALVKGKEVGAAYPFFEELADTVVDQISIEAAQPQLDLTVLQRLPNKTLMVGVIDLGTDAIEPRAIVEERIRDALRHIPAQRLVLAPDCGMKYLPRDSAFGKLAVLSEAAATVRAAL
jgi:5-methyltetrahydropteroyltriglutamate--homocysteine methyltransferase